VPNDPIIAAQTLKKLKALFARWLKAMLAHFSKVAGVAIPIALVKAIVSETSVVRNAPIPALLGLAVLCCLLGLLRRHHRRHRQR